MAWNAKPIGPGPVLTRLIDEGFTNIKNYRLNRWAIEIRRTCHLSRLSLTDGTPIYAISRLVKSSALRVTYSGNGLSPQEFSCSLLTDPRDEILNGQVVDARSLDYCFVCCFDGDLPGIAELESIVGALLAVGLVGAVVGFM